MSVLGKEIHEQPQVIAHLLAEETENVRHLASELSGRFSHVIIAARGTSDNAARYAQYLFGAHNQLQVALATPSLFTMYQRPPKLDGALVIGISQSGQSPDIVSVVSEGKKQGRPTLAITNAATSPLAKHSDFVIPLHAGLEEAVAATKTYTASLTVLALFSTLLAHDQARLDALQALPQWVAATIAGISPRLDRVERYRYIEQCSVIGRGYNYATAFEIALKVKELTRVVAVPYSSADFRHGPIAMIQHGFPVILIAPKGSVFEDLRTLSADLTRLSAEQLIISDDAAILDNANLALPLPAGIPEWLSPVAAILPGQLIGQALAQIKGLDPDQPMGLRKVTETL